MSMLQERRDRLDRFFDEHGTKYSVTKGQVLAVQGSGILGSGQKRDTLPPTTGIMQARRGLIIARYQDGPELMIDVAHAYDGDVVGEELAAVDSFQSSAVALNEGSISVVTLNQLADDPRGEQILFDAASATNERMRAYAAVMREPVGRRVAAAVHELADHTGLVVVGWKDLAARTGAGERPIGMALHDLERAGTLTLTGQTSSRRITINRPQI